MKNSQNENYISYLINKWRINKDTEAFNILVQEAWNTWHKIAANLFFKNRHLLNSLQPTEIVTKALLKLLEANLKENSANINNQNELTSYVVRIMRNIVIDHIRTKLRHQPNNLTNSLDMIEILINNNGVSIDFEKQLALDIALSELEKLDEKAVQIIELWVYGGYTHEEIAQILEISVATVKRRKNVALQFLLDNLY